MSDPAPLSFGARFFYAWACFFKVLFDGTFAARAKALEAPAPAFVKEDPAEPPETRVERSAARARTISAAPRSDASGDATRDGALQLLALLQRDGRLVDFLQQDIVSFSDADVGAAARVVHEGCKKALSGHVTVEALRSEEEGTKIVLEAGFDAKVVKLTGNVHGEAPFKGTLRHKGWRATTITLPELVAGHDARVLAPAEIEL